MIWKSTVLIKRNVARRMIMKLGALDAHKNVCGFAKVTCTQGCGKFILRKDLTQHCNNECSKRKIKCKYCGRLGHYQLISGKHMTVCEEYPVKCPLRCAASLSSGIKRKDLAKHAEICPLKMPLSKLDVTLKFYEKISMLIWSQITRSI